MSEQTSDELKTALRNALKMSAEKPYFFALVTKGGDGALMVDKRKIPPAMVDAAKKKLGGSTVVRGFCFGDEDRLVFETARPSGNLAPLVKKVAQAQAGISIKPEFRVGRGDDGEDEEQDVEESADEGGAVPAKQGGQGMASGKGDDKASADKAAKAAYDALLERVQPQVRSARDAHSAAVAKAAPLLQLAADKAKSGDARAALQAVQTLQSLLEKDTADRAAAMETWKSSRATALTSLKSMASKIAAAKHPSSGKAIMEIQSVIKNLTAEPSSLQQVTELQNWLDHDEVVSDVCELIEDIRVPLDQALAGLRARLA